MPAGRTQIWVQLSIGNDGELFSLTVVEEAGMEQVVEFSTAELAATLRSKGSVALHEVHFDTGKASLKPGSAAVLAPVGELLRSDPALRLEIQGHTDNVGSPADNLGLSTDRAAAVSARPLPGDPGPDLRCGPGADARHRRKSGAHRAA